MSATDSIVIRASGPEESARVSAFYTPQQHPTTLYADEQFVMALDGERLVGVVRLCQENGYWMLRTMWIDAGYRRRGIGSRMLQLFEVMLGERECYCVPLSHLPAYYGQIGFEVIPTEDAPSHLQERCRGYCNAGISSLVMKRSARRSDQ